MRVTTILFALLVSASALADTAHGPVATMPKVGDTLSQGGEPDWPKLTWLYDAPSANDAAGKITIHWFCNPKGTSCMDDLARLITLRDTGKVYIVAYINAASTRDAKKLDPIRESEGVGKGTLAYGRGVTSLVKQLGLGTNPTSVVVDQTGKVQLVTMAGDPQTLDSRDAKVNDLAKNVRDFTTAKDGPTTIKAGDKFTLSYKVELANWLNFNGQDTEFDLMVAKEIKCDATTLKGSQLKVEGHTMTASVTCSGPHGIYEAAGKIRFGYDGPNKTTGFGDDGTKWKFQIN
ncbi:MAG TPA: hypothetical protein VGG74_30410 [Kofleriaceae bacterium]|jgi:hypothetical protein